MRIEDKAGGAEPPVLGAPRTGSRRATTRFLVALIAPLLLYVATAAPTIYNLDSAELTTAAHTGGLVRATGYPLYLLLGRFWSHLLPIGDVGYRMNLLSAVCGALTVALTALLFVRLRLGAWASLGALGLLASSLYFWGLSLIAEVYTLHTLFVVALLLTLARWRERPSPGRMAAATALFGLALGNHVSTALLAAGCFVFAVLANRREAFRPRTLVAATVGLLLGLSVYLYLPWSYLQEPRFNYCGAYDAEARFTPVDLTEPSELLALATGRGFFPLMMAFPAAEYAREAGHFAAELWRAFAGVGFVPGLLGLGVLARRDRPLAVASALFFLGHAAFFVGYAAPDKLTMFLPCYLVWALWLGAGFDWLTEAIAAAAHRDGPPAVWWRAVFPSFLVLAVAGQLAWNLPLVDRSRDDSARRLGEAQLRRAVPGALVVGSWTTVPVMQYLQLVEGRRPDVELINRLLVPEAALGHLLRSQAARRAVYVDLPAGAEILGVRLERGWPLRRVRLEPRDLPVEPDAGGD